MIIDDSRTYIDSISIQYTAYTLMTNSNVIQFMNYNSFFNVKMKYMRTSQFPYTLYQTPYKQNVDFRRLSIVTI